MYDIVKIIENVKGIYDSNNTVRILKDFERVLDELDMYVYENWENGELVEGPIDERHVVKCSFMWPLKEMPNPVAGQRLLDYGCKVTYKKDFLVRPREIKTQDDYRPGTRKGKLDQLPIWVVEIAMPKSLVHDMYKGYLKNIDELINGDPNEIITQPSIQSQENSDVEQLDEPQA
jgi:hypothetical protein